MYFACHFDLINSQFQSAYVLFRISFVIQVTLALCHMTQLTNRNLPKRMAVMNDAQLSKDFDGLYLAKGILMFALSPRDIHNIACSVFLSIYFAQKTNGMQKYQYPVCLFILCIRNSTANISGTQILMTSCN